ncbi:Ribosomal RNA-processing 7 [Hyphodiscus hymeniophilus]|uniref:Ribosomal RNA-processing 7 n=1 Tax=Hyphodiscus hymeniophilus TaxID=353542 RepID=A0A9P7B134_9HELO|nr:Ribosomal RNA-processing 7 [Hyphodiscus hymeniophilus]
MSKIGEYTILPLSLPPTTAYPVPATHTLYLRPHAPKIPTESDSRSLFIVNVPVDSTIAHFKGVFKSLIGAGRVEDVRFEHEQRNVSSQPPTQALVVMSKKEKNKKRKRGEEDPVEIDASLPQIWDRDLLRSGSTAVVVLVDEKSVESALKTVRKLHKSKSKDDRWPVWGQGVEGKAPALGSARYLSHHKMRYPDTAILQKNVDAFMTAWNHNEDEKARSAKRQRNVPDEDGFVTVTKGGRIGPARRDDVERKQAELEEREKKKREELGDFYRFQMRERRKAEQGELVKQFEEDKKRVEAMKEKRGRFRPER